jgi:hypothetical protein
MTDKELRKISLRYYEHEAIGRTAEGQMTTIRKAARLPLQAYRRGREALPGLRAAYLLLLELDNPHGAPGLRGGRALARACPGNSKVHLDADLVIGNNCGSFDQEHPAQE